MFNKKTTTIQNGFFALGPAPCLLALLVAIIHDLKKNVDIFLLIFQRTFDELELR